MEDQEDVGARLYVHDLDLFIEHELGDASDAGTQYNVVCAASNWCLF